MNETKILSVTDVNFDDLSQNLTIAKRPKGKKKKGTVLYFDVVCAFDIETSMITDADGHPHAFMYVWQFQFGDSLTVMGRTWEEFTALMQGLHDAGYKASCRLHEGHQPVFMVFVHNLAYEWQFLQGVYRFENEDCFFRDERKPIYVRYDQMFEFRCSYLHSNMSLAKFAENVGCQLRKLSGAEYDYSKVRFPWTPLTDYEIAYCVHDVRVLVEAIEIELERDEDTLYTIPLTSTGYVRRDVKRALAPIRYSLQYLLPDLELYQLLRRAFRGGDTHANRFKVGTITGPGASHDIESSYPYVICTKDYPMGAFRKLDCNDTKHNPIDRIINFLNMGKAVVADYVFKGIRLKNPKDPMPYLPIAKSHCYNFVEDNGRILSADLCVVALTEIDLKIVLAQYDYYSIDVSNAYVASKGKLPQSFRDVVISYYTAKTQLKKVEGKEYEYVKSKNKINSTFGMTAQQPIHPKVNYSQDEGLFGDSAYQVLRPTDEEAEEELAKAPFPYQWGVYTTAYARESLRKGMACVPVDEQGFSRIIYCDTDSIKYEGSIDVSELNQKIMAESKSAGATAIDPKGNMHHMGIWDDDGSFKRFTTQGAKRYAYEDEDGYLHVTVSGVTKLPSDVIRVDRDGEPVKKSSGYVYEPWANVELEKLENFKSGMIWRMAGGTAAVYNDQDNFDYVDPETKQTVHISPNVCIVDSTYEMGNPDNYEELVENAIQWVKFKNEKYGEYK